MSISEFARERVQAYADHIVAVLLIAGGAVLMGWAINHFALVWNLDPHVAMILAWVIALLVAVAVSLLLKPKSKKYTEQEIGAPVIVSPTISPTFEAPKIDIRIDNSPSFSQSQTQSTHQHAYHDPNIPEAKFTFGYTSLHLPVLPIDERNHVIAEQRRPDSLLNQYEMNIKAALVRFEYETTTGIAPRIDIRAQVAIWTKEDRIPKYDGVWHVANRNSKRFVSGDYDNLVLAVVVDAQVFGYQFQMKNFDDFGQYASHELIPVSGPHEYFFEVKLIGTRASERDHIIINQTEWFFLDPTAPPGTIGFVGLAKPPSFIW
jgi:hypothetical protein